MSQGMTPEFALGYRALMLDGVLREAECTKRVIGAVPDAKADYRPDPNARTAKELMWHLANTDVQFLDGIADLNFGMESRTKAADRSRNRGLVRREPQAGRGPCAGDDTRATADTGWILRSVQFARCAVSRVSQQPQHSSPRRTGDVSAAHGIESAFDLRRQLRRAVRSPGSGRGRGVSRVAHENLQAALRGRLSPFGRCHFPLPNIAFTTC